MKKHCYCHHHHSLSQPLHRCMLSSACFFAIFSISDGSPDCLYCSQIFARYLWHVDENHSQFLPTSLVVAASSSSSVVVYATIIIMGQRCQGSMTPSATQSKVSLLMLFACSRNIEFFSCYSIDIKIIQFSNKKCG